MTCLRSEPEFDCNCLFGRASQIPAADSGPSKQGDSGASRTRGLDRICGHDDPGPHLATDNARESHSVASSVSL